MRVAAGRWVTGLAGVAAALGLAASPARAEAPGGEALVTVKGVVAPFSTFGLLRHLMGIPGVQQVQFNLLHGVADMKLWPGAVVTDKQIRDAVSSASYTAGEIRWSTPTPGNRPTSPAPGP